MEINKIYCGNSLDVLKTFPDEFVNCVMTSPPYWGLRNYNIKDDFVWDGDKNCVHEWGEDLPAKRSRWGDISTMEGTKQATHRGSVSMVEALEVPSGKYCVKCGAWKGQLGNEPDFNLFIKYLADIFDEVKRVLRKGGSCYVNLGDSYFGGHGGPQSFEREGRDIGWNEKSLKNPHRADGKNMDYKDKCLTLVPFRFAVEMVNRGWIIRNCIIWDKPNSMPESVRDRFTQSQEYIFFFVKDKRYFFEQQLEPIAESTIQRVQYPRCDEGSKGDSGIYSCSGTEYNNDYSDGRNKRTVWQIPTKSFSGSHFAVFPETLVETPLKASCPKWVCNFCGKPREKIVDSKCYSDCGCGMGFSGGVVLDPFMGSGTTALVALKQDKRFVGIEASQEYVKMAYKRIEPYLFQDKLGEYSGKSMDNAKKEKEDSSKGGLFGYGKK